MKRYKDLNPFLQSVYSPINDKGFIPVTENYPIQNDSINPLQINFGSGYDPSENFFIPPSPINYTFSVPTGGVGNINISQQVIDALGGTIGLAGFRQVAISVATPNTFGVDNGTVVTNNTAGTITYLLASNYYVRYNGLELGAGLPGTVVLYDYSASGSSAINESAVRVIGGYVYNAGGGTNVLYSVSYSNVCSYDLAPNHWVRVHAYLNNGSGTPVGTIDITGRKVFAYQIDTLEASP